MRPSLSNALAGFLGLAGAAALAVPAPAYAITLLQLGGGASVEDTAQPEDVYGDSLSLQSPTTPVSGSLSGAVRTLADTPAGTVAVRGAAGFGWLRAEASLDLFAPLPGGLEHNGIGNLSAGFSDDITIVPHDPALLFQPAILHATLRLDGNVFVAANNVPPLGPNDARSSLAAGWDARVDIFDGSTNSAVAWNGQSRVGTNAGSSGTSVPTVLAFQLPVRLGSAVPLQLSVGLFVQVAGGALQGRGDVSGIVALYDTLSWGGITAITTTDGTPIEFDVLSGSGVDWSQPASAPVPLPGTAWLVLAGLGAIGLGRDRRCASRR